MCLVIKMDIYQTLPITPLPTVISNENNLNIYQWTNAQMCFDTFTQYIVAKTERMM